MRIPDFKVTQFIGLFDESGVPALAEAEPPDSPAQPDSRSAPFRPA
ncbi:hypothetical protein BTM25_17190 [Actinomadura rubteroloni]|uniref:Uncharacterized protein n=1 Tax=Actinomadura rubteroloni TaxID=1926885 RepID=A0A2P4UQJ1_9ACTN|nr:hypothetical protein [Actinomadura rubteroloni]POM27306.1 hypothetical protein BTM25_17190 [Actinomadura rubteroloni]